MIDSNIKKQLFILVLTLSFLPVPTSYLRFIVFLGGYEHSSKITRLEIVEPLIKVPTNSDNQFGSFAFGLQLLICIIGLLIVTASRFPKEKCT